jgi:hypothetical protein
MPAARAPSLGPLWCSRMHRLAGAPRLGPTTPSAPYGSVAPTVDSKTCRRLRYRL